MQRHQVSVMWKSASHQELFPPDASSVDIVVHDLLHIEFSRELVPFGVQTAWLHEQRGSARVQYPHRSCASEVLLRQCLWACTHILCTDVNLLMLYKTPFGTAAPGGTTLASSTNTVTATSCSWTCASNERYQYIILYY